VPTSIASKVVIMVYAFTGVPLFIYTGWLLLERRIRDAVGWYIHEQEEHLEEIAEELEEIEEDIEKVEKELKKRKKESWSKKEKEKHKSLRKRLIG
jgi:predicted DNA-binding transcriptional regulator